MTTIKQFFKGLLPFILLIGVITLTSCHEDDPTPPAPKEVQKTILMYLPFTGGSSPSLYDAFQENLSDIESSILASRGLGDNKFLVYISKSTSMAHLINFNYKDGRIQKDTLETYRFPELTTVDGLSAIITKVKTVAPARDYAMIVGCHGEGWIPANPSTQKRSRYFGSASVGYKTDASTLADALEATNTHLQFLLFDACYMSCIETAYDLRNATDYIIGSTSEVMNFGMPYKKMFPLLISKEPDYEKVISEFHSFYSSYTRPYGTLAATCCQYVDDMALTMREINAHYAIDDYTLEKVQDLDAGHRSPTVYFDFGDYVEKMLAPKGDENDGDKAALLDKFRDTLGKLVPYKATTGRIMSGNDCRIVNVEAFSGLTISDPTLNRDAVTLKTSTNWWIITH